MVQGKGRGGRGWDGVTDLGRVSQPPSSLVLLLLIRVYSWFGTVTSPVLQLMGAFKCYVLATFPLQ
jgi:hypothetical protein